jgi:hypothetical protein
MEQSQKMLAQKFELLYSDDSDSAHIVLNNRIIMDFENALRQENSFDFDFEKLSKISKLISEDKKLKIYTWHIQFTDGNFKYFGFVQYKNKKRIELITLYDKSNEISNPENKSLTADNWYGVLYYKIITKKIKGQGYYTLLGWDGNTNFSNKKLIDVITFTEGIAQFGVPIFQYQNNIQNRIIFEFGEQVNMVLRYDSDYKMIIWDHLAPSQKQFEGQYQYYGPDFSYDGLIFRKGLWNFAEKITPLNKENNKENRGLKYGY